MDNKIIDFKMEKGLNFADWLFLTFLLFLGLRLTNSITWSYWWVTAPLWIPTAIGLVALTIFLVTLAWRK